MTSGSRTACRWFRRLLVAWLASFHVSPPAELAHAVATLDAHHFERLYRGYACYAEIHR